MTNATGIKGKFIGQPMIDGGNFLGSANVYMPIYFKFNTCVAFVCQDLDNVAHGPAVDTTTANAYWLSSMTVNEHYNWMALGHG